jgi:DNA repair exonuclease SbcCD ATPase subunit
MKIKHKLLADYQYVTPDKKIFPIKAGTIIDEYIYKVKDELIPIDKDIIDNNPDFFEPVDWKYELLLHIKSNKIPQPTQMQKKMIPFIEEMVLSSITQNTGGGAKLDVDKLREIEERESIITRREKNIKDKDEEIELRLSRVEKREKNYKEDLKVLDSREEEIREKSKELSNKLLDIDDKLRELSEKERNLDRTILESSKDIDGKYDELRRKIDSDIEKINKKEKELEVLSKELNTKSIDIQKKESILNDKIRDFRMKVEEFKLYENELKKLNAEIADWEKLHWKFKRSTKPPSAE